MHQATLDKGMNYADISTAIMGEEAFGYVFKDSAPGKDAGNADCNVVDFDFSAAGAKDCSVLKKGSAAPDGYKEAWSGTMWVENSQQDSTLFRQQ